MLQQTEMLIVDQGRPVTLREWSRRRSGAPEPPVHICLCGGAVQKADTVKHELACTFLRDGGGDC